MRKLQFGNPKELVAVVSRRRWWFLIPATLLGLAAGLVAIVLPAIYVSDTLILVEPRGVPDEMVVNLVSAEADQRLNSIKQKIISRTNLLNIYKEFDDELVDLRNLNDEQRLRALSTSIRVEWERANRRAPINGFRIYYEDKSPRLAQKITRRLADLFIQYDSETREEQVFGTGSFLEDEVDKVRIQMEEKDKELTALKKRYQYELPSQLDTNHRMLDRLQEQRRTNTEALDRAYDRRLRLQRQLSETPMVINQPTRPGSRRQAERQVSPRVAELRQKESAYNDLSTRYTERHPDVRRAKAELDRLRAEIPPEELLQAEEVSSSSLPEMVAIPNPVYQQAKEALDVTETDIRILEREKETIDNQIDTFQVRIANTPRREQELSVLQREYDSLASQHENLSEDLFEARKAVSLESKQKGERFRVIDLASLPLAPAKPNRLLILAAGALASLGIGAAAAVGRDLLDQRFLNYKEVETFFDMPILVEIPRITTDKDRTRRTRTAWATAILFLAFVAGGVGSLFWIYKTPEVRSWGGQKIQTIQKLVKR